MQAQSVYLMVDGLPAECTQPFLGLTCTGDPQRVLLHPNFVISPAMLYVGEYLIECCFGGEWEEVLVQHDANVVQPMQALDM